jgi:carbon-monoxide dehydrogenase medium subunit
MECKLIRPASLEEALAAREEYTHDALPIAGGQSLLVMMRNRLVSPGALIDLEPIEELRGIAAHSAGISIGAMNSCNQLIASPLLGETVGVLPAAARQVSSTAVRNLGTIGGNVCHNEPGADLPPALLALNGRAVLRRRAEAREVPLSEFFTSYFETALEPDEILTSIHVPPPAGPAWSHFKFTPRSEEDFATVGVAVTMTGAGSRCEDVRIGLNSVGPTIFRARAAEDILRGREITPAVLEEAGAAAAEASDPIEDVRGSSDYKRELVAVFVRRAVEQAATRLG